MTAANGKAPTDGVPCREFNQCEGIEEEKITHYTREPCNGVSVCEPNIVNKIRQSRRGCVQHIRPFSLCLCLDLNTSRPIYIFRSFLLFFVHSRFPYEFVRTIRSSPATQNNNKIQNSCNIHYKKKQFDLVLSFAEFVWMSIYGSVRSHVCLCVCVQL